MGKRQPLGRGRSVRTAKEMSPPASIRAVIKLAIYNKDSTYIQMITGALFTSNNVFAISYMHVCSVE